MTTVAQLIARLQQHDPNLPVVCGGFDEGGYDNLDTLELVRLVPIEPASHGPDFERVECVRPQWQTVTGEAFDALYLDR